MNVYLVRHGESLGNISQVHQAQNCELSQEGQRQADKLAARFSDLAVDLLISSPITRAAQTAEKIAKVVNLPIHYDRRIEEIRRPSSVVGKKASDPQVAKLWATIRSHQHDPDYHHSDEENFFDVKKRMQSFLQELPTRKESNIVVVSHGHALRIFLGLMILGPEFSSHEFHAMIDHTSISNTGLTICEYENHGNWRILTLNDHAHLLE